MAKEASVTVSIAALNMGTLSEMDFVNRVFIDTSRGKTCENAGTSNTSSKVKPSPKNLSTGGDLRGDIFLVAMCKDSF
jgi:hypothetical protein